MNNHRMPPLALRASVVATQGALALLVAMNCAYAQKAPTPINFGEAAVQELTRPANFIEAGALYVDKDSYKFGEYNGLHRKGLRPVLGFGLFGGGGYVDPASGSVERWSIVGTDLGLPVRNLGAEYSQQGALRIGVEYDELLRNESDRFRSLWRGAGTTTLTLPPGYPAAGARLTATNTAAAALSNWNNIQSPNLNATTAGGGPGILIPAFGESANLGTQRRRLGLGGEVQITPQLAFTLGARTERKDGTKMTGMTFGGFRGAFLPEPIDYETNIVESAARWTGRAAHVGIGYNVSFFQNKIDSWSVQNPFANNAVLNNLAVWSGAPDNRMHQVTLDGGYRFSPATKVSVTGAYSRATQNDRFNFQPGNNQSVNFGATSADAKEVQKNLHARLTSRLRTNLDLTAVYRYEDRDNRTPIGTYRHNAQGDSPAAANPVTQTFNNLPLNRRQQTLSLDGRYSYGPGRAATAGFEHQRIQRSMDHPAVQLPTFIEMWASGRADENTLRLGYQHSFSDALSAQVGYAHSRRNAHEYEQPHAAPLTASANPGYFAEVPGYRQFFLSDRNRDKLRAAADFQVTDKIALQAAVDHISDRYPSEFGLKRSGMQTFSLDGTYTHSDALSFNGFFNYEDGKQRQDNFALPAVRAAAPLAVIPHSPNGTCASYTNTTGIPSDYLTDPCRHWGVSQLDRVFTVGAGAKSSQFMGGKLTLSGDVVYSRARTNVDFTGGSYFNNGVNANVYVPAQNLPQIRSTMTDLRLGARYEVNKNSAVRVGYLHRRLKSSDPQFDLFGVTSVQAFIGPGSTSPQHRVNAVSVSYVYNFR